MNAARKIVARALHALAVRPARLAQRVELGARVHAYDAWVRDRGDLTKRLDYQLDQDALVWDVGGHEGQWASDIVGRFGCRVQVFEPAPASAEFIRWRFASNPRISVHPFALGATDAQVPLALAGDASSLLLSPPKSGRAQIERRDVSAVWRDFGLSRLSLLKLNIEGGEYDVLGRLIACGCIGQIDHLQVQFHDFVPQAAARRRDLGAALARSHTRTWCYDFVWENWRRNSLVRP